MKRTYAERARLPHAVYRCYAADGELLYIGCSVNPEERWATWLRTPGVDWPKRTARRELTWFETLQTGFREERRAIEREAPTHNRNCQSKFVMSATMPPRNFGAATLSEESFRAILALVGTPDREDDA